MALRVRCTMASTLYTTRELSIDKRLCQWREPLEAGAMVVQMERNFGQNKSPGPAPPQIGLPDFFRSIRTIQPPLRFYPWPV